jgi:membrane-bound lytic murein transglycosylase B
VRYVGVPLLALALSAGGLSGQETAPPGVPPVVHAVAEPVREPFQAWLDGLRVEALARGISSATLDTALASVEPLPVVVQRDRAQAEFTLTLDAYLRRRLTPALVRDTRRAYARHRTLLGRVSAEYGVPPHVIAAIWAIESNLGRFSGVRPTVQSLATLAWDGRRAAFFREELFAALTILDRGDIGQERLKGSWAGAMGQPQFMPSSYLKYAQDFDEDGRRDIWRSLPDVFASIAFYLKEQGWEEGVTWGREVNVPRQAANAVAEAAPTRVEGCRAAREMSEPLPLERWRELGVRSVKGAVLPRADVIGSLVEAGDRRFLVYRNYEALLGYNCAHAYALSVALLAERIK